MSDKGGDKSKETMSLFDFKIILTGIVGTLIGIIFVLTLIFTGVIVSERYHEKASTSDQREKVIDIVGVTYDSATYEYPPLINGGGSSEDGDKTNYQSLINYLGSDDNYVVITSNSDYQRVLSSLSYIGGKATTDPLKLEDNYFYSGSVILVTAEMEGMTGFNLNSVVRDENYNISIDVSTVFPDGAPRYGIAGKAILIKIPNIQPRDVDVKYRNINTDVVLY